MLAPFERSGNGVGVDAVPPGSRRDPQGLKVRRLDAGRAPEQPREQPGAACGKYGGVGGKARRRQRVNCTASRGTNRMTRIHEAFECHAEDCVPRLMKSDRSFWNVYGFPLVLIGACMVTAAALRGRPGSTTNDFLVFFQSGRQFLAGTDPYIPFVIPLGPNLNPPWIVLAMSQLCRAPLPVAVSV